MRYRQYKTKQALLTLSEEGFSVTTYIKKIRNAMKGDSRKYVCVRMLLRLLNSLLVASFYGFCCRYRRCTWRTKTDIIQQGCRLNSETIVKLSAVSWNLDGIFSVYKIFPVSSRKDWRSAGMQRFHPNVPLTRLHCRLSWNKHHALFNMASSEWTWRKKKWSNQIARKMLSHCSYTWTLYKY